MLIFHGMILEVLEVDHNKNLGNVSLPHHAAENLGRCF